MAAADGGATWVGAWGGATTGAVATTGDVGAAALALGVDVVSDVWGCADTVAAAASDGGGEAGLAPAFKLGLSVEASRLGVACAVIGPVTFAPVGFSTARVDPDVWAVVAGDGRAVKGAVAAWPCADCAATAWAMDGGEGDSDG
jgi:hypothetical protein